MEMQHHSDIVPSMAEVLTAVSANRIDAVVRRERAKEALRLLAKWTGKSLDDLPASLPRLAELIDRLNPISLGVRPKQLSQLKLDCRDAIAFSGLVKGATPTGRQATVHSPAWSIVEGRLDEPRLLNGLIRFVRWCARAGIRPQDVDDRVVDRFVADVQRTSERKNQYQLKRTTAVIWNEIGERYSHLKLQLLTEPPSRLRKTRIPLDQFPSEFITDWNAFATWAGGQDAFVDDVRPVRLASVSLTTIRNRIHLAADALVRSGTPITSVTSLAVLTEVEAFRSILRQRHEDVAAEANLDNTLMAANLIQIARDWVKVGDTVLAKLKELKKKQPKPEMAMTAKNKRLVRQFDDPELVQRFLSVPERIWTEVEEKATSSRPLSKWDLASAQAAIGLAILMSMPIRRKNLTELVFDEHILIRQSMQSTLFVSQADSKTFNNIEFDIPPQIERWLLDYRYCLAPSVIGCVPKYLFCDVNGDLKGFATVQYLVKRYLKLYLGIHMNPHAYRHLAAKFLLDDSPGAYREVQELLGHKKLETTALFYAGLDTRRAGGLHASLLEAALASPASSNVLSPSSAARQGGDQ
jgi:hypothetical protein